jgi:hypothetical protein
MRSIFAALGAVCCAAAAAPTAGAVCRLYLSLSGYDVFLCLPVSVPASGST